MNEIARPLRLLSPTIRRLVDGFIITGGRFISLVAYQEKLHRLFPQIPNDTDGQKLMGAPILPQLGCKDTIVISIPQVKEDLTQGNLGFLEYATAHEISHVILGEYNECEYDWSRGCPRCVACADSETSADLLALELLEKVAGWNLLQQRILYQGTRRTFPDIYSQLGFPGYYVQMALSCESVQRCNLSQCPRISQVRARVRQLEIKLGL